MLFEVSCDTGYSFEKNRLTLVIYNYQINWYWEDQRYPPKNCSKKCNQNQVGQLLLLQLSENLLGVCNQVFEVDTQLLEGFAYQGGALRNS